MGIMVGKGDGGCNARGRVLNRPTCPDFSSFPIHTLVVDSDIFFRLPSAGCSLSFQSLQQPLVSGPRLHSRGWVFVSAYIIVCLVHCVLPVFRQGLAADVPLGYGSNKARRLLRTSITAHKSLSRQPERESQAALHLHRPWDCSACTQEPRAVWLVRSVCRPWQDSPRARQPSLIREIGCPAHALTAKAEVRYQLHEPRARPHW